MTDMNMGWIKGYLPWIRSEKEKSMKRQELKECLGGFSAAVRQCFEGSTMLGFMSVKVLGHMVPDNIKDDLIQEILEKTKEAEKFMDEFENDIRRISDKYAERLSDE